MTVIDHVRESNYGPPNPLLPASDPPTEAMPAPAADTLTSADIQRLRHSLDSSVSENTRKMYASAWRSFQAWTLGRGNLTGRPLLLS